MFTFVCVNIRAKQACLNNSLPKSSKLNSAPLKCSEQGNLKGALHWGTTTLKRVKTSDENRIIYNILHNLTLWKEPVCRMGTFTFDTLSTFYW